MYRNVSKSLSSTCQSLMGRRLTTPTSNAVHKLQIAVEQYRIENYSQELPSRCKKEIIQAANVNHNNSIEEQDLVQILYNIGAQDSVSKNDLRSIILELGDKQNHTISVNQLIDIL